MPPIPDVSSFVPPTTKANPAALDAEAEFLQASSTRIIGRGTEILGEMTSTAVEFSELVAAPLMREGGLSLDASRGAMQAAVYGSTITGQWAGHVREFNAEIERLTADWAAAVAAQFGKAGEPEPVIEAAGVAKLQEVNAAATAAHNLLLDRAKEAGSSLAGGPTPANLQALAAATGPSWMAYNLSGDPALIPMDASGGEALARDLREALANGTVPAPLLQRMQTLQDIAAKARDLQAAGGMLSAGERDFLSGFYGVMGTVGPNAPALQQEPLYNLPELVSYTDLGAGQQSAVLAAVGGGLLALSDKRVGLGSAFLPPSLRNLVDYHFGVNPAEKPPATFENLADLAPMIRAANENGLDDMQAGRELSAALTLEVAGTVGNAFDPGDLNATTLLDASTRNTEANAGLLSGAIQTPVYGDRTDEFVLRGVFGHQWADDGATAARLVDWIGEDALSQDSDVRKQADAAAFGLFTTMTDRSAAPHWDQSAYEFFTDSYGQIGKFEAAPIGAANPAIALSMAKTAVPYLDFFSEVDSGGPSRLSLWDEDTPMYLGQQTREDFVELIMAGDQAREEFGQKAYEHVIAEASRLSDPALFPDDAAALRQAAESGKLMSLLDTGFAKVFEDANMDGDLATTEATQHANWARAGAAAAKEVVMDLPVVKGASRALNILARQLTESFKWTPGVAQSYDFIWEKGTAPKAGDLGAIWDNSKEEFDFGVYHAIVDHALMTDGSGVTLDGLQGADPRLVVDGANGPQLETTHRLLHPAHPDDLDYRDATMHFRRQFDQVTQDRIWKYLQDVHDHRKG